MLIMLVDYFGWGLWYSQFLHASLIYLYEIFDMLIMRLIILIEDFVFFLCFISMIVEYTDILIILIDHLALLSIVILIFAMIVLTTLHIWIHCYTSFDLTCRLSGLYILLIVFEHDICITFSSDCHSLYVCMSDISCTLLDCMMHDYPPSAWLHVVCLCGTHTYLLIFKSLVSVDIVFLGLIFDTRLVALFSLRPS